MSDRARERFAYDVSARAAAKEVLAQRMLGADWIDAYTRGWKISDEIVELVYGADRPAVYLEARIITGKGKL